MSKYRIITFLIFISISLLLVSATCRPTNLCTTEANIYVGITTDKPAPGKIVFICPGESVGVAWITNNAQSAIIDPDFGEVELEGLMTVSPTSDIQYTLKAESNSCIDTEDAVFINVIEEGEKLNLNLNPPEIDRDTGFPVNLIWTVSLQNVFVSENIFVTSVELVSLQTSCNWDKWQFIKTDTNGTQNPFFQVNFPTPTTLATPFPAPGNYEATPVEVPSAVAIADCPIQARLTVECR